MILRSILATISRFHVYALATELARRNALVGVYTGQARYFIRAPFLPPSLVHTWPWLQTPFEALQRLRLMPPALAPHWSWHAKNGLDRHVARTMPDGHVFYALSGVGLYSGSAAQRRGMAYVCDRSSTHIVRQDEILHKEYAKLGLRFSGIEPRIVEKEQREYAQADAVLVPSDFVRRSFIDLGVPEAKVHCIPLGVELRDYRPIGERDRDFRVLFVGALSVRKGLHYLLDGFRRARIADAKLVLVGARQPETDMLLRRVPVPDVEIFGPLPRAETAREMARARVLVLPSVEDGFGLVMAEAMATGCPVIASCNTGASNLFDDGHEGFIVPMGDAEAIAERLMRLRDDLSLWERMSQAALNRVQALGGWDSYGRSVANLFRDLAIAKGHEVDPIVS